MTSELLHDAKVGGPCKYSIIDKYVNGDFILNYIVPEVKERVRKKEYIILGTTLLYYCFKYEAIGKLPTSILTGVHSEFGTIKEISYRQ